MSGGTKEKTGITKFTMPKNDASEMKCALNSFPSLADIGVPQGDGFGPKTARKFF